jgi:uncharacterized protein (DUF427 family)
LLPSAKGDTNSRSREASRLEKPDAPDISPLKEQAMKAILKDHQIAASDDIVSVGGYEYFPPASVRREWLEKAPKTEHDLECPHGVQFYDVVINGERHVRNAWSYESPQPKMEPVRDRFGFWEDVEVR